jgi:hypothetical protein
MDHMKTIVMNLLRILSALSLVILVTGIAGAQQPSPTPTPTPKKSDAKTQTPAAEAGEVAGNYIITSSIEVGVRGVRVDGDHNKYQSDLNYSAGVRLFDTSFLMRSKDGKGELFDSLLVTSTGWGGDPYGQMRIMVEKPTWYRFDGSFRRLEYFNFLNNLANPNFATQPPNPVTGEHGYDIEQQLGDFDLTILPKNERIRFNIGYSPERYSGPAFTTYHSGGDDFNFLSQMRSQSNDYRLGADGTAGPIDFSFEQGFRRFRDDSFVNDVGQNLGANPALSNAILSSITRNQAVRTQVNYSQLSLHTLLGKRFDVTGRITYSSANSNFDSIENITGINWSTRITGALNPPNILLLQQYNQPGNTYRPNTLGDLGVTYLVTDKLRISNTFRVETFQLNGGDFYNAAFLLAGSNGTTVPAILAKGFSDYNVTKYRKIQDTVEFDYQFNDRYSMHFGYRYGSRRDEQILSGFLLSSNVPTPLVPSDDLEHNSTNVFFGGFKARPAKNWSIYFDAEHGTADNVFTRIGNYNFTNIRAKSRYAPNRKVSFNLAVITRDNANPSEIAGISLSDFGVSIKTRTFTSAVDWTPNSKVSFSTGYNYNWVNSDAVVDYFFNSIEHPLGHSLYFMRNNFFFFDVTAQLFPRVALYASYRINQDGGQGSQVANPTGAPGTLISSYPMHFESPEARLAIKINKRLDWNVGYQYYNYMESLLVGPRPQNYHAHLPYTSLRLYIGRKE